MSFSAVLAGSFAHVTLAMQNSLSSVLKLVQFLELREIYQTFPQNNSYVVNAVGFPVRKEFNFSWHDNAKSLEKAGYKFCPIVRDNWACAGDHYVNVLKSMHEFDNSVLLHHYMPGTILLVDG